MKMKVIGIAAIASVLFLGAVILGLYGYANGLWNTTIEKETALNAQYQSNQNYLSSYISGFYEQVGVANLKSDKMNEILLDAVKGRYESSGGFKPNGAMFSAIAEAYPNLDLKLYDKIVQYIQSKREGYRLQQDKLLDMVRSYDQFRQSGLIQRIIISSFVGAPTDALEARVGTQVWHGKDAREKMLLIVLTADTKQAYETGTMGPLQVPGANSATPAPVNQQIPAPTAQPTPQPQAPATGPKPGGKTTPPKK